MNSDSQILWRIVQLAIPYRRILYAVLILAVLLAPLRLSSPYLINLIVDHYIQRSPYSLIALYSALFILMLLLQTAAEYGFVYLSEKLGQEIILTLRTKLYNRIMDFRLQYFDRTPIGKLTTRCVNDIETLGVVFTRQGLPMIIADFLSIIAILILMLILSVKMTLIFLLTMPLMLIATYIFKEKVKRSFQRVRQRLAEMNAFMQERISGIQTVHVLDAQQTEMRHFDRINAAYTKAHLDTVLYYSVFFPVVDWISSLALALMVWWGAVEVLHAEVTIGTLVAFPIYIQRIFRPIRFLADKFNNIQMAMVASHRVFRLMDDPTLPEDDTGKVLSEVEGAIRLKGLYFGYDPNHFILKDIHLYIPSRSTCALVGATGSGKTSIANIICKLYDYQKGHAYLDGEEIRSIQRHSLRKHTGVVLQDVFLFTDTILENIRLRDSSISRDQVVRAARQIGVHELICQFPDGYDYMLQERGANLSVGQRQLIAFVRVLVLNPRILILDEPTSSIDVLTEKLIQDALPIITKNRTTIIIAHRLSTIRNADKIVVMEDGRIVEEGDFESLLHKGGYFKNLYQRQSQQTHIC